MASVTARVPIAAVVVGVYVALNIALALSWTGTLDASTNSGVLAGAAFVVGHSILGYFAGRAWVCLLPLIVFLWAVPLGLADYQSSTQDLSAVGAAVLWTVMAVPCVAVGFAARAARTRYLARFDVSRRS